jgi:hypothetical protein
MCPVSAGRAPCRGAPPGGAGGRPGPCGGDLRAGAALQGLLAPPRPRPHQGHQGRQTALGDKAALRGLLAPPRPRPHQCHQGHQTSLGDKAPLQSLLAPPRPRPHQGHQGHQGHRGHQMALGDTAPGPSLRRKTSVWRSCSWPWPWLQILSPPVLILLWGSAFHRWGSALRHWGSALWRCGSALRHCGSAFRHCGSALRHWESTFCLSPHRSICWTAILDASRPRWVSPG